MITNLAISFVVLVLGSIFSWLPQVTSLPTIAGYDIDTALVTGMGQVNVFFQAFWPLAYMFYGFLAIMGYFALKLVVKFFFGSRAPTH